MKFWLQMASDINSFLTAIVKQIRMIDSLKNVQPDLYVFQIKLEVWLLWVYPNASSNLTYTKKLVAIVSHTQLTC